MVAQLRRGSLIAAFLLFAFPSLASAHLLAVSAGPSKCVTPLGGEYTATVTITETAFGGSTEVIPVGQNVHELSTSTDHGDTGLNQNYFTQGAVGTQTGPANLGQPTTFTSPSDGAAATQTFTVTTSVPETYVLGNGYMRSPSSATITAPSGGCAPPTAPSVTVSASTQCTTPANGTYSATIDIDSTAAFTVAEGTTGGSGGVNFLSPNLSGAPSSIHAGHNTFTLSGLSQPVVYVIGAPGGNISSASITPPSGGCQAPSPACSTGQMLVGGGCVTPACAAGQTMVGGACVTPSCPTGQTMAGGVCITPACTGSQCGTPATATCGAGQTMSGGRCVTPPLASCPALEKRLGNTCVREACRVTASSAYRVRAGETDTIVVSVRVGATAVPGAKIRVTLPGGRTIARVLGSGGITLRLKPGRRGMMYLRSSGCTAATIKVYAAKVPVAHHPPAFTG